MGWLLCLHRHFGAENIYNCVLGSRFLCTFVRRMQPCACVAHVSTRKVEYMFLPKLKFLHHLLKALVAPCRTAQPGAFSALALLHR